MSNIYKKTMRDALKEARDYREPEEAEISERTAKKGEITITKGRKVQIIKAKNWPTYQAKGWSQSEEVEETEEVAESLLDKDGVDSMGNRVIYDKYGYRILQKTKDGLGDMFVVVSKYKRLLIGWSAKPGGNKATAMKLTSKDKFKWKWGEHSSKYGGQAQGMLPVQTPEQLVAWLKKKGIKEDCGCGHDSDCDCPSDCDCGCNIVNTEKMNEGKDYRLLAQRDTMNLSKQSIAELVAKLYKKLDELGEL